MLAESLFNEKAIKRYLRYGYDNGGFKEFSFQQASMLGLDRFQGWQCSAGAANVFIECNGDVYPCQVYANEGLPPVGNTNSLDASLQLPEETCKCIDCSCEIFLPKRLTK
jgi:MoaA/NifB/PqqE/SkfB family radical SAM enzyme